MSDGNFNRALLPHTPYASGLKAGKSMMKMKAIEAFARWIEERYPELSAEQRHEQQEEFRKLLGS
ncbi:MAG: hypothetical protein IJ754_01800 [Bacteroidaceae bacterium]|nr:hypothetical protein [Bacteroidaceae bacterium]